MRDCQPVARSVSARRSGVNAHCVSGASVTWGAIRELLDLEELVAQETGDEPSASYTYVVSEEFAEQLMHELQIEAPVDPESLEVMPENRHRRRADDPRILLWLRDIPVLYGGKCHPAALVHDNQIQEVSR